MLKVHNSKVANIQKRYRDYAELREEAKTSGVPFEELKAQRDAENEANPVVKKGKKGKKVGKKKKAFGFAKGKD